MYRIIFWFLYLDILILQKKLKAWVDHKLLNQSYLVDAALLYKIGKTWIDDNQPNMFQVEFTEMFWFYEELERLYQPKNYWMKPNWKIRLYKQVWKSVLVWIDLLNYGLTLVSDVALQKLLRDLIDQSVSGAILFRRSGLKKEFRSFIFTTNKLKAWIDQNLLNQCYLVNAALQKYWKPESTMIDPLSLRLISFGCFGFPKILRA